MAPSAVPLPPHEPKNSIDDKLRKLRADDVIAERFRLVDVLGRGGMGMVWRALDETLELPVALKFLPDAVVRDTVALNELKNETRNALRLTHPNILRVYNLAEDRERSVACIVMELASGGNLDLLRAAQPNGWFEPIQIHGWLDQLCAALMHAHEVAGVVHRDLKPGNLLLDETGNLKIADFGLAARASESFTQLTGLKTSGTPVFASPQQMRGDPPKPADDLYALGATIYCLLTGHPPFFRGHILHQLFESTPAKMNARRREIGQPVQVLSEGWEALVADLLAKDSAKRPASARVVQARLNDLRHEKSQPARPVVSAPAAREEDEPEEEKVGGINWKFWISVWVAAGLLASTAFWAGGNRDDASAEPTAEPEPPPAAPVASVAKEKPQPKPKPVETVVAKSEVPAPAAPAAPVEPPKPPEPAPASSALALPERVENKPAEMKPAEPVPAPPVVAPEPPYRVLVHEAKKLRTEGEIESAIVKLHAAIELEPQNPEAIAELAVSFERLNRPEQAAQQWQRILDLGEAAGTYYLAAEARVKMTLAQALAAAQMAQPTPAPATPRPEPAPAAAPAPVVTPPPVASAPVVAEPVPAPAATPAPVLVQPPPAPVVVPAPVVAEPMPAPVVVPVPPTIEPSEPAAQTPPDAKSRQPTFRPPPPLPRDLPILEEASKDAPVSSLKPEAVLGVGEVVRETRPKSKGNKFTLRIPIKASRSATINVNDVDIVVLLYDEIGKGRCTKTDADVSYRFTDPPVNWATDHEEAIEVTYDRSLTGTQRKFYGYLVRIYHKGELQDVRAEPAVLAGKFPAPEQFSLNK